MNTDWTTRAAVMTDQLIAAGKLTERHWRRAFRTVPRHVLVPTFYVQDRQSWQRVRAEDEGALDWIYSNRALFTDVDERGHGVSSSMPGLMARMLELLRIHYGDRVLEVGTGTGYNAALLCQFLGSDQVFSVDVDYVDTARERLASLGYHPTLRIADGVEGMPDHAPFDRIMATVAVRNIPFAWVKQVRDGGLILADVKRSVSAGNLVLLHKYDDGRAEGRFDAGYAAFMGMRHPDQVLTAPAPSMPTAEASGAEHGVTRFSPRAWLAQVPWFLASFGLPGDVVYGVRLDNHGQREVAATFSAGDGSYASVALDADEAGLHAVTQTGPTRLWDSVEDGYVQWERLGRPPWERFGLTVTSDDDQVVWLDAPDSSQRWRL